MDILSTGLLYFGAVFGWVMCAFCIYASFNHMAQADTMEHAKLAFLMMIAAALFLIAASISVGAARL